MNNIVINSSKSDSSDSKQSKSIMIQTDISMDTNFPTSEHEEVSDPTEHQQDQDVRRTENEENQASSMTSL